LYRFKPVAAPLSTPSIHRQIDSLAFFTGVGTIAMELEMVAAAERFQAAKLLANQREKLTIRPLKPLALLEGGNYEVRHTLRNGNAAPVA
jgi:hypothetical protein